ncbi:hypothetical protein [Streptomyces marispadix]|uniref:Uncharacterized protein n=1 Tax=Streptomyces marispadix TaxID=2922868 RepID=A0ABS9SZS1_9ACTN|nr:hypothetical protein [Streptomyces marispadix]MCH6161678.1 hypothetical protein [Streptomyces marispadix]
MSRSRCRHALVPTAGPHAAAPLSIRRCPHHSRDGKGASMWVWGSAGMPREGCPCGTFDRFLVASEHGEARWRENADVIVGRSRPTVAQAERRAGSLLYGAPGCALAVVPAGESGAVFRTPAEQVVVSRTAPTDRVCAACAYPWLAVGHSLTELAGLCARVPGHV